MRKVIDKITGKGKSDIAEQAEMLGLSRLMYGRHEYDKIRLEQFTKASKLDWLSTSLSLPPDYSMETVLEECLERGTNIRLLGWSGATYSKERPELLRVLGNQNHHKGTIEIRYYDEEPKWFIQRINDVIYAQPYLHAYLHDASVFKLPMFVCKKTGYIFAFFERFEAHFEKMWEIAKDIQEYTDETKEGESE